MTTPIYTRRRFLSLMAGTAVLAGSGLALAAPKIINPCKAALPQKLASSPWLARVWEGLDPDLVWDSHVHLAGTGDGDSGIVIGQQLASPMHPLQYGQRLFYMNAGCVDTAPGQVDRSYVARLLNLTSALPTGFKVLLFAFDRYYDEAGRPDTRYLALHVPNEYACQLANAHPERFAWAASIHPYRADALEVLSAVSNKGAAAIKWLPSAMGIDPASPRCLPFYRALARADLPLIVHGGREMAVKGPHLQHYNNPLRLRPALDQGVRVVMAHCASLGQDHDLDRGKQGPLVDSFALFARMMDEPRAQGLLFGDISAIIQRNRPLAVIRALLTRQDWHPRLLQGSDYPLPGILPLFSPATLAQKGLLPAKAVSDLDALQEHNPLLFDLAVKRLLSFRGSSFGLSVFHTKPFFEKRV